MINKTDYERQANSRLIAVDFDDTITEHVPYPQKAPLNKKAKKYLDKLNNLGYSLILWSARLNEDYEEAYNRCVDEFDLYYMIKDSQEYLHGKTGKLIAAYYIDDKSSFGKVKWRKIYKYIVKNIK